MPPTTSPELIHVGRGDLYIGVTVPATGSFVTLTNGVPGSGRYVGSTMAESLWAYKPKSFDIKTQQSTGNVGYVVIEEELDIEFTFGEITYQNLKDLIPVSGDQGTFISVGGNIFPIIKSALIVAPRRAGGYIQAMIYQAYFAMDRVITFAREKDSPVKATARAQAVTTRVLGDQLGYLADVTT